MKARAWVMGVLAVGCPAVLAQEPAFMEAATHPGTGRVYSRVLILFEEGAERDVEIEEQTARLKLAYGITPDLAALLDADLRRLDRADFDGAETGLGDWTLRLKARLLRRDFGPINTWRTSIQAGADIPGTNARLSSHHASPRLGIVSTLILGRHGFNAQLDGTMRVNEPDIAEANASYLYRLAPRQYTAATSAAWYAMFESLNTFREGGDYRADAAAGILYEARRWAWEAALRIPAAQRGGYDFDREIATGLRYLF